MCHLCDTTDTEDYDSARPTRAEAEELLRDQERAWNALPLAERERRSRMLPSDPWVVAPTP